MKNKPAFSVSAADIDASGKHFEAPIAVEWLRGVFDQSDAEPVFGDGHVDVRLFKSGSDVVVRGRATAKVQMACGRCLQPVEVVLSPEISSLMVPTNKLAPAEDERDMTAGDADVMPYDGETVVLDELLRDELLLDVPMIPLCSEACPGIPTQARAAEPAIDPRLLPLRTIQAQSGRTPERSGSVANKKKLEKKE